MSPEKFRDFWETGPWYKGVSILLSALQLKNATAEPYMSPISQQGYAQLLWKVGECLFSL